MKCELYLRRKNSIPFVCLRLPDVIGPFDNTNRFWITLSWMEWSDKYPLCVSANDETSQLSMVDSADVARCIVKLIGMEKIPSNAYNIAFD
jgi:nucleoside-diphosphate-sugar epimerase